MLMEELEAASKRYKVKGIGKAITPRSLMYFDPDYEGEVKKMEEHWLADANKVLGEIIGEIRNRITDPTTTVGELVKALDTISDKYNIQIGKPTSVNANYSLIQNLPDEELEKRIKELEDQFLPSPTLIAGATSPLTVASAEGSISRKRRNGKN